MLTENLATTAAISVANEMAEESRSSACQLCFLEHREVVRLAAIQTRVGVLHNTSKKQPAVVRKC